MRPRPEPITRKGIARHCDIRSPGARKIQYSHRQTPIVAFYGQALKPLGITGFLDYDGQDGHADLKGFGNDGRFSSGRRRGSPILMPFISVWPGKEMFCST
jgi:hypothetical protein